MTDYLQYLVWLTTVPGIGSVKARKILEYFKEPEAVFRASLDNLLKLPFITKADALRLIDKKYKENLKKHIDNIYKYNISVIPITDENYPENLKNIYDPPMILYVKGSFKKEEKYLAIVGSRKATSYGLNMAEVIAKELSKHGFTIVSGLARGIDSSAHNACVKAGVRNIAVLGCGLDITYPSENKALMEKIIQNGAAISEYPPGIPPSAQNFPARNRIISGLSLGVIVIEASDRSGSLITADFALEQGREVFAVPGNLSSTNSIGTNRLIREGAKIITGIEDILGELPVFLDKKIEKDMDKIIEKRELNLLMNSLKDLDDDERLLAESLLNEELHIDALINKTGFEVKKINSLLIILELNGIVEQLPGKIFRIKK